MDERFMHIALEEAWQALAQGEVPVGAVLVHKGKVITRAHNLCEAGNDATAHAELQCIREASKILGPRLNECTLYCTLEPCAMCAGAAILAKVSRIVYGAFEERTGCCGSVIDITDGWFNHSIEVLGGILEDACAAPLLQFFEERR